MTRAEERFLREILGGINALIQIEGRNAGIPAHEMQWMLRQLLAMKR
jgi:hypothetical protein